MTVSHIEGGEHSTSVSAIPSRHFLLADEVGQRPVASIVTLRGSTMVGGVRRPFLIWATRSDHAVEQRSACIEEWNAVQVFLGGDPASAQGAPWAAEDAELSLCFVAGEPHFKLRAQPELDEFRWGELSWSGGALYDVLDPEPVVLDDRGHLPLSLLPPVLRPLTLDYGSSGPPPSGYVYKEKRLWGIALGGAALFTLSYTIPLISAAASDSSNTGSWAIPIAGPLLVWGEFLNNMDGPCSESCALRAMGIASVSVLLWADTIVQVAGIGGIFVGSFAKKRWWERTGGGTGLNWSMHLLPVAAGSGLQWAARF